MSDAASARDAERDLVVVDRGAFKELFDEMMYTRTKIAKDRIEIVNGALLALSYASEAALQAAPAAPAADAGTGEIDRFERILAVARWAWATDDNDRHGDGDLSPELALDKVIADLLPGDLGVWSYEPYRKAERLPRAAMSRAADRSQDGGENHEAN